MQHCDWHIKLCESSQKKDKMKLFTIIRKCRSEYNNIKINEAL